MVFGSFVRGQAREDSDIDVLVVRPTQVPEDDLTWMESLGRWSDLATEIVGNSINLMVVLESDVPELLQRPDSVWQDIAREGEVILGSNLRLLSAA